MREMKDSGVEWLGEVPAGWDVLGQKWLMRKKKVICEKWVGENVLSLTTNGVIVRDINSGKGKFPTTFDGYQRIEAGNLILCLFDVDVTPRCVGLAKNDGVTSPAYSQFELLDGADARFYDYYLRAMDDRKFYVGLTSTLRHSFTADDFGLIKAVRPPLAEQQRIADFLDVKCAEIDRAVDTAEKSIEELMAYRASYLENLIARESDYCQAEKLKYVLVESKEKSSDGIGEPLSITIARGVLRSAELNVPNPTSSLVGAKVVRKGDLVFNKLKAHFGVMYVSPFEGLISPEYAIYRAQDPSRVSLKYIEYVVHTQRVIDEFIIRISGVADGFRRLYTDDLFDIAVCIPPYERQLQLVEQLNGVYSSIEASVHAKQAIIADLKAYKQSLIYEVVTGKREV